MKYVLILMILMCFTVTGCGGVNVYTFKKERVDQDLSGNRGFVGGKAAPEEKERDLERTIIGVDVELSPVSSSKGPILDFRKKKKGAVRPAAGRETVPEEPSYAPSQKGKPSTVVVDTREEKIKEEWVK